MKKVLIILFSLILVVGCKKNNNTTDNPKDNEPQEVIHTTMEDVQNRLTEIATEVYNNKNYVGYSKENGKYNNTSITSITFVPTKVGNDVSKQTQTIYGRYDTWICC